MFAKVLRLRHMGALVPGDLPVEKEWLDGILEFSRTRVDASFADPRPRRLVLRDAMASPDKGVMLELFDPKVIDVPHPYLRLRGIEPAALSSGAAGGMLQDWLVRVAS